MRVEQSNGIYIGLHLAIGAAKCTSL